MILDVDFYWERDWVEVRADEVRPDDLYANGGTVTESRPWDEATDGPARAYGVRREWLIRCGDDWSSAGAASRRVVVGRNARRVLIADDAELEGAF